ncbi:MAG: ABC-2 type transport system ATP-binding protein [Burkholderiaceae bacterium]|jgi:ABC-2 type transport system ATP-binding protein|tara:strand:+ start:47 stop:964 length:918 start_codon:yes stop_codon:yes gene_type:complete
MIEVNNLCKQYANGFMALDHINLSVKKGEILALLGPNGAGKTTLISVICGIVNPSSGSVTIGGFDIIKNYRKTRSLIGLVPQELTTDAFETPWDNLTFSRGLFGLPKNPQKVEQVLKDLSLWDKKDERIMTLSGGMKRRLLIGKALVHEPQVLFLDEPTAGVDVGLRQDMWRMVDALRIQGVTIVLTTHYIEEAEAIADRIGVINGGKLLLVEDKQLLMSRLGQKQLKVELMTRLDNMPAELAEQGFRLAEDCLSVIYQYDKDGLEVNIAGLLQAVSDAGLGVKDIHTQQSSLEEIFVDLVGESV